MNLPPASHDSLGNAMAARVTPLTLSGTPDPLNGKIVLLSIGMSNTTQEFSVFKTLADTDRARNRHLTIVDGAQGGQTAAIIADSTANFWKVVDQRLASANVSRQQVQAVWAKEADANPTAPFPLHAERLDSECVRIVRILKARFVNLRLCYWSSRIYGGYATTTLNPEPFAYESGFAIKWLIERQIRGDSSLAPDGPAPAAPWLAWGPYLWANGSQPRSDSLVWLPADFGPDGTHPSDQGRLKVARLLLQFFKTERTAQHWFFAASPTSVAASPPAIPAQPRLEQNYPNPFNPSTTIRYALPQRSHVTLTVFNTLGQQVAMLINGEVEAGYHEVRFEAGNLASGVYFYRLLAGVFVQSRRFCLVR